MSKSKDLAINTAIITIGKLSTQFISFILLPIYTKYLTTADYGVSDFLSTVIVLVVPILTLQMEQAAFRFLVDYRKKEYQKKKLISTVIFFLIGQCILITLIYLCSQPFIRSIYKNYFFINVLVCMVSGMFLQLTRGVGNNIQYTIASFISSVVAILLNILFVVFFKMGATGLLLAMFFSNLISAVYLFFVIKIYSYVSIRFIDKELLKQMIKYSLPLIPNSISWWIMNMSDRTIITVVLGAGVNGLYAVANKFPNIFIQIYNIFNLTWMESVAININEKDNFTFFKNTLNSMFKLFSSVCIGIIAVMPFLFHIMINEQYKEAYNQIPILTIATLFNVVIGLYSTFYIAKKMTNVVARTSMICAVINIITNLILIKFIGLYAASLSTAIAFFVMMIYRYYDVKKIINIPLETKNVILITILLGLTTYLYYSRNITLQFIILVIDFIICIVINKKMLTSILNFLIKKIKK